MFSYCPIEEVNKPAMGGFVWGFVKCLAGISRH